MIKENLPAGIEMIIPADGTPPEGATHCEYHPDKLILFFDDLEKGETVIKYRFRAIFPGMYQVRPAYAESMYIPEINGYSGACRLRIRK
jgi:uncharacterized protein YfaS (alpha-2-macroglobulin family)